MAAAKPELAKIGFRPEMVVQELGWDEDVDDVLRMAVEDAVGGELIEEAVEAVDAVVLDRKSVV